jgi:multiple sugar transport system permease protein
MKRREHITAFGFLAPSLIGFLAFTFLPLIAALALSLSGWDLFHPPRFVGLRNYQSLLGTFEHEHGQWSDPRFWKSLGNTLFLLMVIPLNMLSSLLLAVILNQRLPARGLFRTALFLPSVCAGVALLLLWKCLLDPQFGLINRSLETIGVTGPGWLTSDRWAKPGLMLMMWWAAMGGPNMIIYLAALQGVPGHLYEAARIDGANRLQCFLHITLPMLSPATFFILITSLIAGFQGEFDAVYVMTQGGPDGATSTLTFYLYNHAFQWFNMGYASAIAMVLFALILFVTLTCWWLMGRRVHYE